MPKNNSNIKTIGILASGGNAPAMNNVIITLVRKAKMMGINTKLIYDGYKGLHENRIGTPDLSELSYFNDNGNVIIGTSRYPTFRDPKIKEECAHILKKHKIDALAVIGGNGSYAGAYGLIKHGIRVMGFPGTIDNDINSTDLTIGYSTALNAIVHNIDSIRDCYDSHSAICLVEVMGRRFPDLAINAGIAVDAEGIITAQNVLNASQIASIATRTFKNKHKSCIIVVTEFIYGKDGLITITELAKQVEELTGRMTRAEILGRVQRGGVPTAEDRVLANLMASKGLDYLVSNDKSFTVDHRHDIIVFTEITQSLATKEKEPNVSLIEDFFKYNGY